MSNYVITPCLEYLANKDIDNQYKAKAYVLYGEIFHMPVNQLETFTVFAKNFAGIFDCTFSEQQLNVVRNNVVKPKGKRINPYGCYDIKRNNTFPGIIMPKDICDCCPYSRTYSNYVKDAEDLLLAWIIHNGDIPLKIMTSLTSTNYKDCIQKAKKIMPSNILVTGREHNKGKIDVVPLNRHLLSYLCTNVSFMPHEPMDKFVLQMIEDVSKNLIIDNSFENDVSFLRDAIRKETERITFIDTRCLAETNTLDNLITYLLTPQAYDYEKAIEDAKTMECSVLPQEKKSSRSKFSSLYPFLYSGADSNNGSSRNMTVAEMGGDKRTELEHNADFTKGHMAAVGVKELNGVSGVSGITGTPTNTDTTSTTTTTAATAATKNDYYMVPDNPIMTGEVELCDESNNRVSTVSKDREYLKSTECMNDTNEMANANSFDIQPPDDIPDSCLEDYLDNYMSGYEDSYYDENIDYNPCYPADDEREELEEREEELFESSTHSTQSACATAGKGFHIEVIEPVIPNWQELASTAAVNADKDNHETENSIGGLTKTSFEPSRFSRMTAKGEENNGTKNEEISSSPAMYPTPQFTDNEEVNHSVAQGGATGDIPFTSIPYLPAEDEIEKKKENENEERRTSCSNASTSGESEPCADTQQRQNDSCGSSTAHETYASAESANASNSSTSSSSDSSSMKERKKKGKKVKGLTDLYPENYVPHEELFSKLVNIVGQSPFVINHADKCTSLFSLLDNMEQSDNVNSTNQSNMSSSSSSEAGGQGKAESLSAMHNNSAAADVALAISEDILKDLAQGLFGKDESKPSIYNTVAETEFAQISSKDILGIEVTNSEHYTGLLICDQNQKLWHLNLDTLDRNDIRILLRRKPIFISMNAPEVYATLKKYKLIGGLIIDLRDMYRLSGFNPKKIPTTYKELIEAIDNAEFIYQDDFYLYALPLYKSLYEHMAAVLELNGNIQYLMNFTSQNKAIGYSWDTSEIFDNLKEPYERVSLFSYKENCPEYIVPKVPGTFYVYRIADTDSKRTLFNAGLLAALDKKDFFTFSKAFILKYSRDCLFIYALETMNRTFSALQYPLVHYAREFNISDKHIWCRQHSFMDITFEEAACLAESSPEHIAIDRKSEFNTDTGINSFTNSKVLSSNKNKYGQSSDGSSSLAGGEILINVNNAAAGAANNMEHITGANSPTSLSGNSSIGTFVGQNANAQGNSSMDSNEKLIQGLTSSDNVGVKKQRPKQKKGGAKRTDTVPGAGLSLDA